MMPGINGQALRERLRAHPNLAHVPVLLMTAAYKVQAPEEFAGIIPKPFDIDDLLSQVHRHL
jgi:CheY-like chemotaxis protein